MRLYAVWYRVAQCATAPFLGKRGRRVQRFKGVKINKRKFHLCLDAVDGSEALYVVRAKSAEMCPLVVGFHSSGGGEIAKMAGAHILTASKSAFTTTHTHLPPPRRLGRNIVSMSLCGIKYGYNSFCVHTRARNYPAKGTQPTMPDADACGMEWKRTLDSRERD